MAEEQVVEIAKAGNLLAADDTINLIHYTAYLTGDPARSLAEIILSASRNGQVLFRIRKYPISIVVFGNSNSL